jgi:hypothetical protein
MSTTAHDAAPMLIGWCELRKDFRRFHASLSRGRDHRHRLSARAAGLWSLAGGSVSAQTVGLSHAVNMLASNPSHEITLSEEEVSDVSLATFYVFDKENSPRVRLAARGGGGGRGAIAWAKARLNAQPHRGRSQCAAPSVSSSASASARGGTGLPIAAKARS